MIEATPRQKLEWKFLGHCIGENQTGLFNFTDENWYTDPISIALYKTIVGMIEEKSELSTETVVCRVEQDYPDIEWKDIQFWKYCESLGNKTIPFWNELKHAAVRNKALKTSGTIQELLGKHGENTEQNIVETIYSEYSEMVKIHAQGNSEVSISNIFESMDKDMQEDGSNIHGTGFESIDRKAGFRNDYMFLAAQYGIGKTPFALRVLIHNAIDLGKPCIYFSGENRNEDILKALIAMGTGIELRRLRIADTFTKGERRIINQMREKIAQAPIRFMPNGRVDSNTLQGRIQKNYETYGTSICILDQFSHITPPDRYQKRNDNLDALADKMYDWKFQFPMWYLVLAQLKTKIPSNEKPSFTHFMFCSQPEQNTDIGAILDRPAQDRNRMDQEKRDQERDIWKIRSDPSLSEEEKNARIQLIRGSMIKPGQALYRQEKGRLGGGTFEVPLGWDEHSLGFYQNDMIPELHPLRKEENKDLLHETPF